MSDASAAGKLAGTHPNAGVPVRVGVPPSAGACAVTAEELPPESCTRIPAMVSTLPLIPFGNFGVFTGRATLEPLLVR